MLKKSFCNKMAELYADYMYHVPISSEQWLQYAFCLEQCSDLESKQGICEKKEELQATELVSPHPSPEILQPVVSWPQFVASATRLNSGRHETEEE